MIERKQLYIFILALISGISSLILNHFYPAPETFSQLFDGYFNMKIYLIVVVVHIIAFLSFGYLGIQMAKFVIQNSFFSYLIPTQSYYDQYIDEEHFLSWPIFWTILVIACLFILGGMYFLSYLKLIFYGILILLGLFVLFRIFSK